jgi:hypothetical protein
MSFKSMKPAERCSISNGAEPTPTVEAGHYFCPGSMHDGDRTIKITQYNAYSCKEESVILSPETMKAIIRWNEGVIR